MSFPDSTLLPFPCQSQIPPYRYLLKHGITSNTQYSSTPHLTSFYYLIHLVGATLPGVYAVDEGMCRDSAQQTVAALPRVSFQQN